MGVTIFYLTSIFCQKLLPPFGACPKNCGGKVVMFNSMKKYGSSCNSALVVKNVIGVRTIIPVNEYHPVHVDKKI